MRWFAGPLGIAIASLGCGSAAVPPGNGDLVLEAGGASDVAAEEAGAPGDATDDAVGEASIGARGEAGSEVAPGDAKCSPPVAGDENLVLWLQADQGVVETSGGVQVWRDQSGRGNDARATVAGSFPTLVRGAYAGHAAIEFSVGCTPLDVLDDTSLQYGTDDLTYWVVAEYPASSTAIGILLTKNPEIVPYDGFKLFVNYAGESRPALGQFVVEASTPLFTPYSGASFGGPKPHVFGLTRRGTTVTARVDGTAGGSFSIPATFDGSATGANLQIGCVNPGASWPLAGRIAEIIALRGSVDDCKLVSTEQALRTKFGL
jgi:hypothetical protein